MDFDLQNCGSIFILVPLSDDGKEWANDNLPQDAMSWGGGVAIEHRYVCDIVAGIQDDGLTVQGVA